MDVVFKIAPISDHVAKFRGDRPRDRGDLALNKKKKEKKQQQNISARALLIATGGPNSGVAMGGIGEAVAPTTHQPSPDSILR